MVFVLLKNLFYYKTVVPKKERAKSYGNGTFPSDFSPHLASRKPRLNYTESLHSQQSEESERLLSSGNDTVVDLEAQTSGKPSKKIEENSQKKEWRINPAIIRDATIGLSDGLTVPFALTAGLSALGSTKVVIYGGFAELIAGAISMGLGGYLGAKSEAASYESLREETEERVATDLLGVKKELLDEFQKYGFEGSLDAIENDITNMCPQGLVDLVLRLQHCEKIPESSRPFISGLTISLGYFLGGLLPLLPYLLVGTHELYKGLCMSIGVMVVALFMFGYGKTSAVSGSWFGRRDIREGSFEGVQMIIVGSVAAAAAMGCVKLFDEYGGNIRG